MTPARLTFAAPLLFLAACGSSDQDTSETAPASPAAATSLQASASNGPAAFATCRACHSAEPGRNGVGPSLFGIVGTKAGDVPGYNFSPALKESGVTWDRQTLDTWLQGPMQMVPGTNMVIGVSNPEKRKEIIDYLETLK